MEIKELVDYTFKLKVLRNHLEAIALELRDRHVEEMDDKDRCGLPFDADMEFIRDASNSFGYGLKQINEGINYLEAAHRRSIRYKEPVEEKPKEEKKPE